jgi:hypothetical protein
MCHTYDTLHQPLRQSGDIMTLSRCIEATPAPALMAGMAPLGPYPGQSPILRQCRHINRPRIDNKEPDGT